MEQLQSFKVVICYGYTVPEVMDAEGYEHDKDFVREVIWSGVASDSQAASLAAMENWKK